MLTTPRRLGEPIPDSIHALSVSMPLWQDNIDYEEGVARIHDALKTGYPRFIYHDAVKRLFVTAAKSVLTEEEHQQEWSVMVFPSLRVAEECIVFIEKQDKDAVLSGVAIPYRDMYAVKMQGDIALKSGRAFWQHTGELVSSRHAMAVLGDEELRDDLHCEDADMVIRERIGSLVDASVSDIFLYPSGMSAIYNAFRLLRATASNRCLKTVMFGFPYVDTLKILEKFNPDGTHFFPRGNIADMETLTELLESGEQILGLFCEFPGNPLLRCVDIHQLHALSLKYNFPIVIDDTIGNFANTPGINVFSDIVVTSLTKLFSGACNVMAGSLVLSHHSTRHKLYSDAMHGGLFEPLLFSKDSFVLEINSRDFVMRSHRIDQTTEQLVDWLQNQPNVLEIFYPKLTDPDFYNIVRSKDGGFGGLFSLFMCSSDNAATFYDALSVCKGPSLGTNFTLVCPYVILAHFEELEWAKSCGIESHIIRVSVGLESFEHLRDVFSAALSIMKKC